MSHAEEEQVPDPDEDRVPYEEQDPYLEKEFAPPAKTWRDVIIGLVSLIIRCLTDVVVEWIRRGGHSL